MRKQLNLQFALGAVITIAGLALLFWGLMAPPLGTIDSSVLVAFGEVATFAGSLIGVDYHYRFREFSRELDTKDKGNA